MLETLAPLGFGVPKMTALQMPPGQSASTVHGVVSALLQKNPVLALQIGPAGGLGQFARAEPPIRLMTTAQAKTTIERSVIRFMGPPLAASPLALTPLL
jgi:hypothetical protein